MGTNMHLLNLTIKSYIEAAKIGLAGAGRRQRGWGGAGRGSVAGGGGEGSCSFSQGVYGSEGACVPVKSTHRAAQHMLPQITVSRPPPTPLLHPD